MSPNLGSLAVDRGPGQGARAAAGRRSNSDGRPYPRWLNVNLLFRGERERAVVARRPPSGRSNALLPPAGEGNPGRCLTIRPHAVSRRVVARLFLPCSDLITTCY